MIISENKIVGDIVAMDYRTASIFENFGIDYCCHGNISIAEACKKRNISSTIVIESIIKLTEDRVNNEINYNSWPLDLLTDYIEKKHHKYVEEKTPVLKQYLDKICQVHGKSNPELFEINKLFNEASQDLAAHMKKEEFILFPYIRRMVHSIKEKLPLGNPPFGTVQNPVQMMMREHDSEGERFRKISSLAQNYNPPINTCNTYKVTFALLKEFEKDLHLHIHLENNILFPKTINMEKELKK